MTEYRLQHLSAVIGRGISLFFNAHLFASIITAGLIILFPRLTSAHQVTLAWDPNTEPDLGGYIAYWGTSSRNYPYLTDVGNNTTHTITGLEEGQVYYFAITAYDSDYNESGYSDEVVYSVSSTDTGGTVDDDGVGGGCFIATAAFGSPMTSHVMILRQFRDQILLPNKIGLAAVVFYYKHSPPLADYIAAHDNLRKLVRWSLLPIVALCWLMLTFGPWTVLAAFVFSQCVIAAIPIIVKRRRKI
ncbi:MAG: CFI-box-CTERM domain-containing protein [Planctomycetota bacterium]